MKYDDLTHEQKELVLHIENTEKLYKRMKQALQRISRAEAYYAIRVIVNDSAYDYHFEDTVFKISDKKAVTKYFMSTHFDNNGTEL